MPQIKDSIVFESIKNLLSEFPDQPKCKIVVAMSGGVDSSVIATIAKEAGHEAIGVTLKLCSDKRFGEHILKKTQKSIDDAKAVTEKIGIKHHVIECDEKFMREIVNKFISSYKKGETPIPCIWCNKDVKLRVLYDFMTEVNAQYLATGHYVIKLNKGHVFEIHKPVDKTRDQTYFLTMLPKERLKRLLFPLGIVQNKDVVRAIARYYGIHVAEKTDSQDICFISNKGYKDFIKSWSDLSTAKGEIKSKDGEVLGYHEGIENYTIGQRRGIGVACGTPLYVLETNPNNKSVTLGKKEDLKSNSLIIDGINWFCEEPSNMDTIHCSVKLRSGHIGTNAEIQYLGNGKAKVLLQDGYYGVTPGQACVMYDDTLMIGGGWITKEKVLV